MLPIIKNVLKLATTGIMEFTQGSLSEGLLPAAAKTIQQHFKSSDNVQKYYSESIQRSVRSLEIALKGPRAYYPTREKEFYQKHFVRFEQNVFHPFAEESVKRGMVESHEELRNKCIQDCEKLKALGPHLLKITSFSEEDVQEIMDRTIGLDPELSNKMIGEIRDRTGCYFLAQMFEKDNVLLSGIVFHFNIALQENPEFSGFVNHLELNKIKNGLANLQKNLQKNPGDPEILKRLERMDQLYKTMSSYKDQMGAISQKLDSIYQKTVQTYETLQRLEVKMDKNFGALEERLNAIYALLAQGALPSPQTIQTTQTSEVKDLPVIEEKSTPKIQEKPAKAKQETLKKTSKARVSSIPEKKLEPEVLEKIERAKQKVIAKRSDSPKKTFASKEEKNSRYPS